MSLQPREAAQRYLDALPKPPSFYAPHEPASFVAALMGLEDEIEELQTELGQAEHRADEGESIRENVENWVEELRAACDKAEDVENDDEASCSGCAAKTRLEALIASVIGIANRMEGEL